MTKAQETLKDYVEKINDDTTIEKINIFIMGILTQQNLEKAHKTNQCVEEKAKEVI